MVTVQMDSSRCAGPATAGVDGGLRSTGLGGRSWCKRAGPLRTGLDLDGSSGASRVECRRKYGC